MLLNVILSAFKCIIMCMISVLMSLTIRVADNSVKNVSWSVIATLLFCLSGEGDAGDVTMNEKPMFMYYVNDGVYGSFNCLLFDHAEVEPLLLHPQVGRQALANDVTCRSSLKLSRLISIPTPIVFTALSTHRSG